MTGRVGVPPGRRQVLRGARDLAVAGGAGVLGVSLASCSALEQAGRHVGLPGATASPTPDPAPPVDPDDPDVRLAVEVALLSDAAATALRTWAAEDRRATRRTRRLAGAAADTHAAHADLVGAAVPPRATPGTGGLSPALLDAIRSERGTLRSLVRIEELAGAGLREAALTARSGAFAGLLASMVAASAQHSAVLRGAAPGGQRG